MKEQSETGGEKKNLNGSLLGELTSCSSPDCSAL